MFHIDELNSKNIIKIVESVEDTLQYESIELFKQAMTSIGFVVRLLKRYPIYGNLYSCKGKIEGKTVHLDIYQRTNNDVVYVYRKRYYREILVSSKRVKRLAHRENDLPAVVMYDEKNGKITELRYYVDNQENRKEKNPVHIMYTYNHANEIVSTYYRFICEKYRDNFINFSLYEAIYKKNLIIDVSFCYNNELLTLQDLHEILPDITLHGLDDLLNLKNIIAEEQLKLIEMYTI